MKIKSMKKLVRRGGRQVAAGAERATESAIKQASLALKSGAKTLKKAEKSGSLETWRKRVALGVQLIEVAMLATAAAKGLKIGKAAKAPPRRAPKRRVRRAKARG